MNNATVQITLTTPYCQSRSHDTPKLPKELPQAREERTWQERLHTTESGEIVIPGLAFANCIKECAKFLGIQIPNKGKSTWTKHFQAGVSVLDDVKTGVQKSDAIRKRMFVPSDGVAGSGKRVVKYFPLLMPPLTVSVDFDIYDDLITPEVFAHHLQQAGLLIGIGAFRIRNNGVFGRFNVDSIEWRSGNTELSLPPIRHTQRRAA